MTLTKPVVVGLDGSKSATHAVRWAAEEAARRNTGLVITHSCVLLPARALLVRPRLASWVNDHTALSFAG